MFRSVYGDRFEEIPSSEISRNTNTAAAQAQPSAQPPAQLQAPAAQAPSSQAQPQRARGGGQRTRRHGNNVFRQLSNIAEDEEASHDNAVAALPSEPSGGVSEPVGGATAAEIEERNIRNIKSRRILVLYLCPFILYLLLRDNVDMFYWCLLSFVFYMCAFVEQVQMRDSTLRSRHSQPKELKQGVTQEAKSTWLRFVPKSSSISNGNHGGDVEMGDVGCVALSDDELCSICLCEYEADEVAVQLPCSHVYHDSCLNEWTQNHVRCPLCNVDLNCTKQKPTHDNHDVHVESDPHDIAVASDTTPQPETEAIAAEVTLSVDVPSVSVPPLMIV